MAQKITTNIFIDTSAFKAVFDSADDFNSKAVEYWKQLLADESILLITTNFVLDETYTLFRSHLGRGKAVILHDKIALSPKSIKIVYVNTRDEREAWEYFKHIPGRGISFTDCTSFRVMERLKIKTAFTFDNDFKSVGFEVMPSDKVEAET